ncbi:protein FAR1-RELATED SEQUENCE 9-like [Salvia miltiorrhiza]|uniref:protein FAR1-RELATED SEQUENCE 9-like n=1 Tax=Salvia miltiorrhiza TaxID=226208 RepID=UPI0025ABBEF7|nr:protein FAR1-RELATED SEQUENCE 9-like [Salvia miltiorrhiza]
MLIDLNVSDDGLDDEEIENAFEGNECSSSEELIDSDVKSEAFKAVRNEIGDKLQTMVTDYDLSENRWFWNMYNLRKRWASVFTNEKFTAGLHATSRSKVTNKVLKDLCSATTSLHEFVIQYERLQHEWRLRESEEDTMCRGVPGQFIQNNNLLKHAASVYTRNVYKTFECEVTHSLNVKIMQHPYDFSADALVYAVSSSSSSNGIRTIHFRRPTRHASCSCQMWEAEGILCRHILNIMLLLNIDSLPAQFILYRWRKDAKNRFLPNQTNLSDEGGKDSIANMIFVNHNMKTLYDLMLECKGD